MDNSEIDIVKGAVMAIAPPGILRREEGQGLVEYALIILLVGIAIVGSLALLKDGLSTAYSTIAAAIPS